MLAAQFYDIKAYDKNKKKKIPRSKLPLFTVLIPAHNEEACIAKTVKSVLSADYPRKEIVVIDDGSADNTYKIVRALIRRYHKSNLRIVRQKQQGKGSALNNGIKRTKGELVMVIDADSTIAKDALINAVKYFQDKQVRALAASVRLDNNGSLLGLIQRAEYLIAYRMKRALTALNIEYIIGGVGSVYRRSTLKQLGGYRTNTITEDIDLSMKVVNRGNKAYRVVFAHDVRTTTQPVLTMNELIKQRYRWKRGRMQAFMRYRKLFLAKEKRHGKLLSWFQLPYAIFGEIYLMIEPLFIVTIITVGILYGNFSALLTAMLVMSSFMMVNFIATDDERLVDKAQLVILAPIIYLLMPILSYVELVSLIKTLKNWDSLKVKRKDIGHWVPVQRASAS